MAERQLPKLNVVGSIPITRSMSIAHIQTGAAPGPVDVCRQPPDRCIGVIGNGAGGGAVHQPPPVIYLPGSIPH